LGLSFGNLGTKSAFAIAAIAAKFATNRSPLAPFFQCASAPFSLRRRLEPPTTATTNIPYGSDAAAATAAMWFG
jgi:hypothetical protein